MCFSICKRRAAIIFSHSADKFTDIYEAFGCYSSEQKKTHDEMGKAVLFSYTVQGSKAETIS